MNTDSTHSDPPDLPVVAPGWASIDLGQPSLSQTAIESVHSELMLNDLLPGLSFSEPTAMLLDVNNLYRRAKDTGFAIDYDSLKRIFSNRCDLRYRAAYSAVDRTSPGANNWVGYMQRSGFDFIGKELVRYTGTDGRTVAKGNMDVEITIAAMKLSPSFTHVIIGSCDGDYLPLVKELQEDRARKVSVLGISGGDWSGMNRALAKQADNFYDLSRFQELVTYRGSKYV